MRPTTGLSGIEHSFAADEVIVSKTDLQGRITYANDIFISMSGYTEDELLGAPHNILRHPNMPRCVFKYLWDRVANGHEVFAYVMNRCKNGDHYWVFAHITPCYDRNGSLVGYHSTRRVPLPKALDLIKPLYTSLLAIESRFSERKQAMEQSTAALVDTVIKAGFTDYDRFILSISR